MLKIMSFSELLPENDHFRLLVSLQAPSNAKQTTQPNFLTVTSAFKRCFVLLSGNKTALCHPPAPGSACIPLQELLCPGTVESSGEGV